MQSIARQRVWQPLASLWRPWTTSISSKPTLSLSSVPESPSKDDKEQLRRQLNKLRYRSHQRGLLEMDILLGKWTDAALDTMDSAMLTAFEEFLEEETPSLYKWVTGQTPFPARLQSNQAFMAFYQFVQEKLEDHSSNASRNKSRAEWLRGWHDRGNQN